MKVVQINSVNYGSTGNIMLGIAEIARKNGHKVYTISPYGRDMKKNIKDHIFFGTRFSRRLASKLSYWSGFHGFFFTIAHSIFNQQSKATFSRYYAFA